MPFSGNRWENKMGIMDVGLGSSFDQEMRYILLLSCSEQAHTSTWIECMDYIVTYAGDYDYSENNLHGYGEYRFAEFSSRNSISAVVLRNLAYRGLITVHLKKQDLLFLISEDGLELASNMNSNYASDYKSLADDITYQLKDITDHDLMALVTKGRI